jgi:peptidyl-tRNA hydrolase, PTH1 family
MKAIFGLGNPGPRYTGTRHNVGFDVVGELARRLGLPEFDSWYGRAEYVRGSNAGESILLAKPLTFMNDSGQAVGELARYFRIDVPALLIVVDEVQLPLGKLRARARGSAGGHNGLKSVIAHLGDEFPRLRVGVGRGPVGPGGNAGPGGKAQRDLADHVLSRFLPGERDEVERMIARAADAAQVFVTGGIAEVMNQYNGGDPATTE